MLRFVPVLPVLLALAACSGSKAPTDPEAERDPAVGEALSDPLMADPDLTSQNPDGGALSGGGPASAGIPPEKRTAEEVRVARQNAVDAAGGVIDPAPAAAVRSDASRFAQAVTAPALVRALGLGGRDCGQTLGYSAIWAARLAEPFAVYPRGHVGQAAGSDSAGCKLRVVGFITPVSSDDVLDYYASRARRGGFSVRRTREGGDETLEGASGAGQYGVIVRRRADGLTEVNLVTAGL